MTDYTNPNDPWLQTGYDPYKGMTDDERIKAGCMQIVAFFAMLAVGLTVCALLGSCTTTKYVQVPVVHNDTTIITKHQRDSIWLHDSVMVTQYQKGDTIFSTSIKWHTKYVTKEVHDTLYRSKTDSIPYPVEVIKEVPAKLTWWQRTRLHLFNIIGMAVILIVVFYVGRWHITRLKG